MLFAPFYDPEKSYEENFAKGPFGVFANNEVVKNNTEPLFYFLGFKINSPFGIAAGPLINGRFVQSALDKGFDIVTYKTVRSAKYPCHPFPNILSVKMDGDLTLEKAQRKLFADGNFQEPLSITNSFGVPSFNPEFWVKDISDILKNMRPGQVLVCAFQGTRKTGQSVEEFINDFCVTAKLLKNAGVKVLEVNLSCPNEGTDSLLCYDTARSVKVVQAIKKEIGNTPLIIKIGYFSNEELLRNFIKEVGAIVDGISAINTISANIVDENGQQVLPGVGRLRSGVCGHAIKWAGLDMVKRLKKFREEFGYSYTVIGVGGVAILKDFLEYRNAGADIVMSATGVMWNPYLAEEIAKNIE